MGSKRDLLQTMKFV